MRRDIVRSAHDQLGHFALDKTVTKLAENYWFQGMKSYVRKYISCCIPCLYNKVPAGRREGFLHPIDKSGGPFHTLHIDHLGPFIRSSKQNTHIVVAVCAFTKYVILKAVKSTETRHVIMFLREIISMFGVPLRLVSDRGTAFTSQSFTKFCKEVGIVHILNAVATPRANGQCERANRTILSALKTMTSSPDKWDESVTQVQFAINNTTIKSIGKTASELLLGFKPRSPTDSLITLNLEPPTLEDVNIVRQSALKKIEISQKSQKQFFDKHRKEARTYKKGDFVLILKQHFATGTSQKLLPAFTGPFQITKILPNDRYEVSDIPGSQRSKRAKYCRQNEAVDTRKGNVRGRYG